MPISTIKPRLITKLENINISEFKKLKQQFNFIKFNQKAKSYDYVELLDKDGENVKIITFREKANRKDKGAILKRYIINQSKGNEIVEERTYNHQRKLPYIFEILNKEFMVQKRKISSIIKNNNEIIAKSEEVQAVTHTENPVLHISKVEATVYPKSGIEQERQSFYSYQKGQPRKGYSIKPYFKDKSGISKTSYPLEYTFESIPENIQEKMISDKYMPLHLYSFKQFKKIAPAIASSPKHDVKFPCTIKWRNNMPEGYNGNTTIKTLNGYQVSKKLIELNNKSQYNKNRYGVINSAAHEKEHAFEGEQINFKLIQDEARRELIRTDSNEAYIDYQDTIKRYPVEDVSKAIMYKREYNNYVERECDREGHFVQQPEVRARLAGMDAVKDFVESVTRVKKEFPYAPTDVLGPSYHEAIQFEISRNINR